MSTLDPSSPLVLDTRDLGRRAGSMKKLDFSVAAPADLGVGLIAVPPGSEIEFDLRLESVIDGVLVTGSALLTVAGECSRCLEPLSFDTEVDLQELFEYPATDSRGRQIEAGNDDDEQPKLDDDLLDLEPVIRDAVLLAMPLAPLCQPECAGLCITCGENLNDVPDHAHEEIDPRWATLANLKDLTDE